MSSVARAWVAWASYRGRTPASGVAGPVSRVGPGAVAAHLTGAAPSRPAGVELLTAPTRDGVIHRRLLKADRWVVAGAVGSAGTALAAGGPSRARAADL